MPISASLEPISEKFFQLGTGLGYGLKGEYFDNKDLQGNPVLTRMDHNLNFNWEDNAPSTTMANDNFSVRWTGSLIPPVSRKYEFFSASDDGVRLYINGKKLIDDWSDHGVTVDTGFITLEAGKSYDLKVEYYENKGSAILILGWDLPENDGKNNLITEAVKAAKMSDVAIIFVGSSEYIESEGFDRRDGLHLSGKQNELIEAVAEANPKTS